MDEHSCHFLPIASLEKAVKYTHTGSFVRYSDGIKRCRQNVWKLQQKKCARRLQLIGGYSYRWGNVYNNAIKNALYSQDWDQLLHLLHASPVWEHQYKGRYHSDEYTDADIYLKAFIVLLTHHPQAKTLGLLEEYLHMVQSCRSDNDKKAVMKVLFSLPDRLLSRGSHPPSDEKDKFKEQKSGLTTNQENHSDVILNVE